MADLHTMNRKQLTALVIKQREALKHGQRYFHCLLSLLAQSDEGELIVEGSTSSLMFEGLNDYLVEMESIQGNLHIRLLDKQMRRVCPAGAYSMKAPRVAEQLGDGNSAEALEGGTQA